MARVALISLIIALSFFGLADSWYLAEHALSGTALTCDVVGLSDCNKVAESPYSDFLGLPLALYGAAFYAVFFVLAALALLSPLRILTLSMFVLSGFGFLSSLYFLYLQLFVIQAVCVYCLASAVIATLLCIAASTLRFRFSPRQPAML